MISEIYQSTSYIQGVQRLEEYLRLYNKSPEQKIIFIQFYDDISLNFILGAVDKLTEQLGFNEKNKNYMFAAIQLILEVEFLINNDSRFNSQELINQVNLIKDFLAVNAHKLEDQLYKFEDQLREGTKNLRNGNGNRNRNRACRKPSSNNSDKWNSLVAATAAFHQSARTIEPSILTPPPGLERVIKIS